MLNHYMSKEDVLDILFANRNKAYGAYLLRREYPSRLKKSMAFMLGGVLLLGAGLEWKSVQTPIMPVLPTISKDTVKIIEVNLKEEPKPIEHPIVRPPMPHPAVQPAVLPPPTIASTNIKLVDNPRPDHIVPPQTDLATHDIGVTTINGPGASGVVAHSPGSGEGTETTPAEPEGGIYKFVEQMPMFPGGEEALRKYLMRNMETPDELEEESQKRVVVRFVVDKDGTISACTVTQSGGEVYDEEVQRVVKHMPRWTPGIQNGRPVPVYFTLPVVFARN